MGITRDEAISLATRVIEERGLRAWWSLKRLSVREMKHPESQQSFWRVRSAPGLGVPMTTVWLDRETGIPLAASRVGDRAWPETWPG